MRYPGFIDGTSKSQSVIADGARTVNWYVENVSDNVKALYPTPGFSSYTTVTDVGARALWGGTTDLCFGVVGASFYEFFDPPTYINRGAVANDGKLAQITYNGPTADQLFIGAGTNGYSYDPNTHVLTLELTGEAHQVGMIDGFILAFNKTDHKLRISDLDDATSWDPTQFALRSVQQDPWQAMIVNSPDIWLLGSETGDIWVNKGTSPFPLAPRTGLTIPYGIAAPFSLATVGGSVFWVSRNKAGAGIVVAATGYNPQPISSPAVDTAIAQYRRDSTIDDAEALVYEMEGHTFYVLRFPTADHTWAYDITTGKWGELDRLNPMTGISSVWAPRVHCDAFGKHLVGDATGTISEMSLDYSTETNGDAIRRLRIAPTIVQEMKRLPISKFQVLVETGLGLQSGQGSDPKMMMRSSPDGGKTWSEQRESSAGPVGKYGTQVFWPRLGSPRLLAVEISCTDPIPWRVIDAYLNNDAGA